MGSNSHRAIVVGLDCYGLSSWSGRESLLELSELAVTAGLQVEGSFLQRLKSANPISYIGKGKVNFLKSFIIEHDIVVFIADDELNPRQYIFLQTELKIKILDRTSLILDIFSTRASSYEAQLQIELAQLMYLLPRLRRMWTHLSRLGGNIGTRGPGETQLEVDRRQIKKKINFIHSKLLKVQQQRYLRREKRQLSTCIKGALVGYTNAGKSTLMKKLTQSDVFIEDKLFATLDPLTRRFFLSDEYDITLTDTVGFIQKLPHHLVDAFQSTLEELKYADFLIHVVDVSHPNLGGVLKTSQQLISQLCDREVLILYVFNKSDCCFKMNQIKQEIASYQPQVFISALDLSGVETLKNKLKEVLVSFVKTYDFVISNHRMDLVNLFYVYGYVLSIDFKDKVYVTVKMSSVNAEKILSLLTDE